MAINTSALQTFTNNELLKLVNLAIAEVAYFGQMQEARQRILGRPKLSELVALRDKLSDEITGAASGRVINLAQRQRG